MENTEQKNSLTDRIVAAAKEGRLKMRPKWHFILKAALWAVGGIVALLTLLYLASLIAFIARKTGVWTTPFFGWHGVMVFLFSIPWVLVLLVLIFIFIVELLVRHYSFGYRMPLLYSGLAILAAVCAGSIIIDRTPLHRILSDCPPGHFEGGPRRIIQFPCALGIYHDAQPGRFGDINDGVIMRVVDSGFLVVNRRQEQLTVTVTPQTKMPFGNVFAVGDVIVIFGPRRGDVIEALGVGPIDDWDRRR
ncbi:MAG: hypothetical protein MUD10_04725 [Candidatus Pacebacteria bacterium]|jgi:hypothetical protein|nr:hypothetical protein [Candidatus Paceibacterota bacterium]